MRELVIHRPNVLRKLIVIGLFFAGATSAAVAQSTYGTIVGRVTDPSGAVVRDATVTITDTDRQTERTVVTNAGGEYLVPNMLASRYRIRIADPNFEELSITQLVLRSRQILRVDGVLHLGNVDQTVTISGSERGAITTDTATIQSRFSKNEVLALPANIRTNGNTSSFNLIRFLPGVEADSSGNYTIQGAGFSQTNFSLDGISTQDVTANAPLKSATISSESIAEIKVQAVGNNAEFGQVGDVTTLSRGGADDFHGDVFEYHTDRALNATPFAKAVKPQYIANDFGGTLSGPLRLPVLYSKRSHTFFLGTYEGFRNPVQQYITNSVPTAAFRAGDFSAMSSSVKDPSTGLPFYGNLIPASRISAQSVGLLKLYPLPNTGAPTQLSNNFIQLRRADYTTDQYDIRIDNNIGTRQNAFGRFTHKNIVQTIPQQLLVPSKSQSDGYNLLVLADTFAIRPNLLNEARFGFTLNSTAQTLPFDGTAFTNGLNLIGIGPSFPFNGLPDVNISNFTGLNTDRGNSTQRSNTTQATDNLSWVLKNHDIKVGVDYRHIRVTRPLSFVSGNDYGQFNFQNSFTGYAFADFLLGLPQTTGIANVTDGNATANHYAAYAQDSFRVTSRLVLEYGVRFEFNPAYTDSSGNLGNFDPSIAQTGAILYPTGRNGLISGNFLQQINACPSASINGVPCTPIVSASDAGLPDSLRTSSKRLVPRFGFAYRLFNEKTVLRGGFGMYDVTVLGSIYSALSGTLQANARNFTNVDGNGKPIFSFPQTQLPGLGKLAAYGSSSFSAGVPTHFKDPYLYQINLSIDRDLGFQTGLRISYVGSLARQLVWSRNLNQLLPSTTAYATRIQNRLALPYPNFSVINYRDNGGNASYNSFQAELRHESKGGLIFDVSYTLAKNLADNQGPAPNAFTQENASNLSLNSYNRSLDYGPVYGTPRHHLGATIVYDLPFGRGRRFGHDTSFLLDELFGGWQVTSIGVMESGLFLTPFLNGIDPSGTGSGIAAGGSRQRVDQIASAALSGHNAAHWFNVSAFVCPGGSTLLPCNVGKGAGAQAPIGRYGNQGIGTLLGPSMAVLHSGLGKEFAIVPDRVRLRVEGTFTNILNHTNLGDPTLSLDNSQVGTITSSRNSFYGGARSGQVGARLQF